MDNITILCRCLAIGILLKSMPYQERPLERSRKILQKLLVVFIYIYCIKVDTCPCCGFEVDRDQIPYCSDPMALSFLGSGFTLFYNYLRYCILILFITLLTKQLYNLYTNYQGSYCSHTKREKIEGHIVELPFCSDSWFLKLSLANKLE